MGKLVAFKRIAVAPPPPKIEVPKDPTEAYRAGLKAGEALLSGTPIADLMAPAGRSNIFTSNQPAPVPVAAKPVPPPANPSAALDPKMGMILYKESDTGIGFKRWAIWLEWTNRWTVWTEWGHENKHQARKQMSFMSETRAKAYLASCIAAKLKRGYRRNK